MHTYRRLLQFVRPYWKRLLVASFLMGINSLTTGARAWLVKPGLDRIFIQKDIEMLKLLPVAILLLYVVDGLSGYAQGYLMQSVGQRAICDIRNRIFSHLQTLSLRFFHQNKTGVLMSRIINDIGVLQQAVSTIVTDIFLHVSTLAVLLGVALYQNWKLALLSLVIFPLTIYPLTRIGQRLKKLSRQSLEKIGDIQAFLQENFLGVLVIKAFGREEYEKERFRAKNRQFLKITMKGVRANQLTSPLMDFIGAVGVSVVILYGGMEVVYGRTTPGEFFSFMAAVVMMYSPIKKMSKINNSFQQAMAAATRVFELLDAEPEVKESPSAFALPPISQGISFHALSFGYEKGKPLVLKEICLEIKKGETVALVGSSGVGKSTLVALLLRFYDPTEGGIEIDGIDLREVTLRSLRSQVGVVTQETFLFNDTVKNNILFGRLEASEEEVIQAARAAYAHPFILGLPQGYDTLVRDRGVRLSGGEKQRIAIARALLKDPPLLILDEATSSLDTESEYMVQKALENLMRGRTTILIAHRLSTVRNADKIVVLENGRISEVGRHEELMEQKGRYYQLYEPLQVS